MSQMERIYKLDRLFRRKRPPSRRDILDMLEISLAQFKRDLEYMRSRLGAPVTFDMEAAGYRHTIADLVATRARQAKAIGVDGLVCSPEEAASLRGIVGDQMALVTPGIRPAGAATGDQKRIMTPSRAIAAGADYLVVGRPILEAADPKAAADSIQAEIAQALT